jgi:hypothetical protein
MRALAATLASSVLILCACGGDSRDSNGSANSPPAPSEPPAPSQPVVPAQETALSGVVAAESALPAYDIEVLAPPAADGSDVQTFPASAGADGRYAAALASSNVC